MVDNDMVDNDMVDNDMVDTAHAQRTTIAGFPALVAGATTAPPVVLLHGAFADEHGFEGWVSRFAAAGFRSVAPARRGRHGVGPERAEGLTVDDYVTDTLAVIDELDEAPVLVGHSLGGLVAQKVAEQGRARAIALVASAPPSMLTAQAIALPRFAPNLPRILAGRPFLVSGDACSVLALHKVPEAERPAIHQHLTAESGRVYRSLLFGTVRVDARKVTVPVHVVGGGDDRIVSSRLVRKTGRHYGVEPVLYDDHGHWLLQEPGWERICDDIVRWTTSTTRRASDMNAGSGSRSTVTR